MREQRTEQHDNKLGQRMKTHRATWRESDDLGDGIESHWIGGATMGARN